MHVIPVLVGFIVDYFVGDPPALYRRLWHPVVPIGKFAGWCDKRFNQLHAPRESRIMVGGIVWFFIVSACFALGIALQALLFSFGWIGWLIAGVLGSSLIAFRGLAQFVGEVAHRLDSEGLDGGRDAVRHLVGRKPESLDEAAVARAGIESLAENFSDGTVAPLFWWLLLGLPGLMAYKAVNTLDSMLGHRTDRLEAFGKVSARMDDLANWLPARLSALIVWIVSGTSTRAARIVFKDAGKHRSPNAGWPESAFAAALDIKLAGPRTYDEGNVDEPFIGEGRADLTAADIRRALALFERCGWLVGALLLAGCLIQAV